MNTNDKSGWISIKESKPENRGKENPIWFYSAKRDQIMLGYKNEYGYYDMGGNGVSFSHWMYLEQPQPPQTKNS